MKRMFIVVPVVLLVIVLIGVHAAFASTTNGTIPAASYAWGENFGWINFGCTNCNVSVTDSAVTGDAWSNQYGWINLSPSYGGVTNDGNGSLGGNAWSSGLGWISFSGVIINSSGQFTGVAGTQGTTAGRINFSCSNCSVTTDWRPASVRNGSSNNNSGNTNNSGNSIGSVSSSGSFLPGFWNLFNNNPFGNINAANINVNPANPVNEENQEGVNSNGGTGTLPAYSFATSTRFSSTTPKTHAANQPMTNTGSSSSNAFSLFSPLLIATALIIVLLVILILRFLL